LLTIEAHALKQLRPEEIEERIRDPAPPANFPTVCPVNPPLRHIIGRLNREIWKKYNLHNIPYRDAESTEPEQIFDGERWPEKEDEKLEIRTVDELGSDVIDIFGQQEAKRREAEASKIDFHDVSYNMLNNLLNAIKNPIEMRLLPHIVREWHRRGFPITMNDAHKIAELSFKLNQSEVVLQMAQLDVYGICYDFEGIREVVRALALRSSSWARPKGQAKVEVEKPFTTDDMLRSTPQLLQCAVGVDAKRALDDPVVLGTQFCALTQRFIDEPEFRTPKRALELCEYADWLVVLLELGKIVRETPNKTKTPWMLAYGVRQHISTTLYDYIPVHHALQQFIDIVMSPWYRCDKAYRPIDMTQPDNKSRLRQFVEQNETLKGNFDIPSRRNLFWLINHQFLPKAVREHKIGPPDLHPWQWAILKQYAPAPNDVDRFLTSDRPEYFAPANERYYLVVRAQHAANLLEKAISRLRQQMKRNSWFERRHTYFERKRFLD
jgi:hypothetical protein